MRPLSLFTLVCLASVSLAASLASPVLLAGEMESTSFVACPIYRDTDAGRKSGCWLGGDPETGIRYDVSLSPTKPDWNFAVLVEGIKASAPETACGGIVLDPVRVSVLPQHCPRHMLPAEGYPGRKFVLPERVVRPLSDPRAPPEGPFANNTFHIFFDHNKSFILYQYGDYLLDRAAAWLNAAKPDKIVITGYAVIESRQVSGYKIRERENVSLERAEAIRLALVRLGLDPDIVSVRTKVNPLPTDGEGADGLDEPSRRRVDIDAVFDTQE